MARINNTNIKTSLAAFRDGAFELDVAVSATDNTVWLTLDQVSLLFEKDKSTVSRHIKNIFSEHELEKEATVAKYATVQLEGSRSVERLIEYYNLDVIISVGYRVKSKRGIAFRKWATTVLNDYLLRGYAENKRRLEAQGKTIELQSRIIAHMAEVDEEERNVVYLSRQVITNGALVAITLMIAESRPEEKDVMITLVMNLLSKS